MSRRIPGKVAAVIVALAMTAVFGTSALAWTGTGRAPGSGYLPHSCDYIRTNVWLSTMSWNYYFNTQSSTWVIGNCPYYPYITDDVQYVQVNGVAISVSFPWAVGVSGTTLSRTDAPPASSRWPRTPTAILSSWHSMTVRFALATRPAGHASARRYHFAASRGSDSRST